MKAPFKLLCRTNEGKRLTMQSHNRHTAKSLAGRIFQSPTIRTVRVVGRKDGTLYLRLVKDRTGKVRQNLTVNIPTHPKPA